MKAIIGLLVLGGIGYGVWYFVGDAGSFDPTEQGRKAKAAIKPGMTWKKVFDAAGEPREYRKIIETVKTKGDQEYREYRATGPTKYDEKGLAKRIKTNDLPHGFIVDYDFSQSVAFRVNFDETGTVSSVQDLTTMSDLLQMDPQE